MYPLGTLMAKKGKCDITAVNLPMPDQSSPPQRSWPGRATLSAILVLLLLSASLTLWWSLHEFMVYETVTVNCVDCAYDDDKLEATTFKLPEIASHTEPSLLTTAPPAPPSTTIPSFSMEFNVTLDDDPEPAKTGTTDISEIIQSWFQTIQGMLIPPFFRAPEPTAAPAPAAEVTTAPSIPSTTEDHSILLSLMNALMTPTKNETGKPIFGHDSGEAASSSEELIPRESATKQLATSSARDQADLPTTEPEANVRINFMKPEQPKDEKPITVYYDDDDDVYDFEEYDDE